MTRQVILALVLIGMALANELESALSHVPGVLDVQPGDFAAHVYSTEVHLSAPAARGFAARAPSS